MVFITFVLCLAVFREALVVTKIPGGWVGGGKGEGGELQELLLAFSYL